MARRCAFAMIDAAIGRLGACALNEANDPELRQWCQALADELVGAKLALEAEGRDFRGRRTVTRSLIAGGYPGGE
jgi:hypothetical protein